MGRRYYLLLFADVVSSLGNGIYQLTLPLLVLKLTGSALNTSVTYAIEYGPFLLLSLPGGVFADRFERRRLLVTGDLAAGLITVALGALVAVGIGSVWPIYIAAFLLACVDPLYHPAFFSFLPRLVSKDRLGQANGWMQTGENVTSLLGPVAAGAIISLLGYEAAVFFDAGTFFFSALAIALIRVAPAVADVTAKAARSAAAEIAEAWAYIQHNRVLLAGSLLFTGTNFAIWLVQANFVYYLTRYRHLSPTLIGVVLAAQGVGSILGAAIAGRLIRRAGSGRVIIGCTAAAGLTTLALIPLHGTVAICLVWGLIFTVSSMNVVAWFSLRARIVPDRMMGRVVGITRMLAFSSIPVSAVLAGILENALHDMYVIFAMGGLIRLTIAVLALRTPLRMNSNSLAAVIEQPEVSAVA